MDFNVWFQWTVCIVCINAFWVVKTRFTYTGTFLTTSQVWYWSPISVLLHWLTLFTPVGGALYCVSPDSCFLFSLNRNLTPRPHVEPWENPPMAEGGRQTDCAGHTQRTRLWDYQVDLMKKQSRLVCFPFSFLNIRISIYQKKRIWGLEGDEYYPGRGPLSLHFGHTDVRGVSFSETFMGCFPRSFWRSWSL